MVLIIRDGCSFCENFKDMKGLEIAKIVNIGGDFKMEIDGITMPIPVDLQGLPTLLDGNFQYVGQKPIEERLTREMAR